MDTKLSIKRSVWKTYRKERKLVNCTIEPRELPMRGHGGFLSETTMMYNIEFARAQFIRIPQIIDYFYSYPSFIRYSITLFDKKRKQFFGRTFSTVAENQMKIQKVGNDVYLMSSDKERILFYLYNCDIENTLLVVEASVI